MLPTSANKIFALLSAPGTPALRQSGKRADDGRYLAEIILTKQGEPDARTGAGLVIEYRILSGRSKTGVDMTGQKYSSVPKPDKSPEGTLRELVDIVVACEGVDPNTGRPRDRFAFDGATLQQLINRAFYDTGAPSAAYPRGEPLNPYAGVRVFVTTEAVPTKGGYTYVRHSWEGASEALATSSGFAWPPAGWNPPEPGAAAPGVPSMPPAPFTRAAIPGFAPPRPPAAPVNLPGAGAHRIGVAPMPPAAPAAPPRPAPLPPPPRPSPAAAPPPPRPAPPPPAATLTPAPDAPGWYLSARFPGWYADTPTDSDSGRFYNPTTAEVIDPNA